MDTQLALIEKIKAYDPKADVDSVIRAYTFSLEAHKDQKRDSGDAYFSHPLEVANILADLRLDDDSIMTALLHDTVEDTSATLAHVKHLFGAEVASLVDGVTKLSRIQWESDKSKQAENFRKLLLAMSQDIRVLLVKLADRLHNMRTLRFVKSSEKRKRIARETMEIYAPLAERIGIHHIKEELQDLAFEELNPEVRESIMARLQFLRASSPENTINKILDSLNECLRLGGVKAETSGREKSPHSIWQKMRRYNISFEQLTDIMAFRIIVESKEDCYKTLGIIHSAYPMIPGRFKDYISTPKPNNYQSIHTSVYGPENQRIEVQIRTGEMHDIAENGLAAHWQYKQVVTEKNQEHKWLRGLLDILETTHNPEEFLEHTKLEMFQDQVFCFTPAGDLIVLPQGATPVDFAYSIHSEVGNHCVGAKRNGRMIPLRSILKNGDQVEILTSASQLPSPTWERFVVTGKAQANIRKFVRSQQRNQYSSLGRSILAKTFKNEHLDFSEEKVVPFLKRFEAQAFEDLLVYVGEGTLSARDILKAVYPGHHFETDPEELIDQRNTFLERRKEENAISLKGLIPGMAIHYAGCCHPLPGDRIVGIVVTGRGITIHTHDCETLEKFEDEPQRWLDVSWDDEIKPNQKHVGRINVILMNRSGSLATLSTIISQQNANIINLKITGRSEHFFEILMDLEVNDADHLTNVMAAMRASSLVNSVERMKH